MRYFAVLLKLCISTCMLLCTATIADAQNALYQKVTVQANKQPVRDVLSSMSDQGGFVFSYNSNILNADSIITINAINKPVQEVLDQLFPDKYHYKQTGKYLILQIDATKYWYVSGYIKDAQTGEGLKDVSVFEKDQLVASLTDGSGYFKIKLKDRYPSAQLSIRKSWYNDTAIVLSPGYNQELNLTIAPKNFMLDSVVVGDGVERTWWASFFLTSKQKAQSLNLGKFFVDRPYQASLVPGLSTHGRMSSNTVNKASVNLLGGYTGGVKGVEIGGLFNINKNDASYLQAAGLFNIVGDDMAGVQGAGLYNFALDSVVGLQASGVSSMAGGDLIGIQASGLYNHAGGSTIGLQAAGLANLTGKKVIGMQVAGFGNIAKEVDGTQIAGFFNVSAKEINGTQIAGFFNLAKKMDGAQVGFINISDTSSGVSVGFLNIVFKGYHKFALYYNETFDYNLAIKTGSPKLYNIFLGAVNSTKENLALSVGYGFGTEIKLSKRLAIAGEGTAQYVYLGNIENTNILTKAHVHLNFKLYKFITIFGGPTYNIYSSNQTTQVITEDGTYKLDLPRAGYGTTRVGSDGLSWFGGSIGLMFF